MKESLNEGVLREITGRKLNKNPSQIPDDFAGSRGVGVIYLNMAIEVTRDRLRLFLRNQPVQRKMFI